MYKRVQHTLNSLFMGSNYIVSSIMPVELPALQAAAYVLLQN